MLHPQPSCRVSVNLLVSIGHWSHRSKIHSSSEERGCTRLYSWGRRRNERVSVTSQGLFAFATTYRWNVERRVYTRNFVSTCETFVALNRASELASIFCRDFCAILTRFHCDLARLHCNFSTIDYTAILLWSRWVMLRFSARFHYVFEYNFIAFSVRFQCYLSTISTRCPSAQFLALYSTMALRVPYTWNYVFSILLCKTITRNNQILRSLENVNIIGELFQVPLWADE